MDVRKSPLLQLIIALTALIAGGCDLTQPNLRKETAVAHGGRVVEPKRCAVTVAIISRPQNDRLINEVIWQDADEQVIEPKVRQALQANGIRVGRITGELPLEVETLMHAKPPDRPGISVIANPSGQSSLLDAAQAPARPNITLLLSQPDGKVTGKSYDDARGFLRLTPTHASTHDVSVKLVPELHHGPVQQTFGMLPNGGLTSPHEFQIGQGQKEENFRDLAMNVTLTPGQVLVIGVRPDRSGTLGDLLFQKPEPNSDRVLQNLVLIWARRNEIGSAEGPTLSAEPPSLLSADPADFGKAPEPASTAPVSEKP